LRTLEQSLTHAPSIGSTQVVPHESRDASQAILGSLGLVGRSWTLPL